MSKINGEMPAPSVLIVDDEPSILDQYSEAFRSCGYRVFCAESGTEGVALAVRHCPSVIVLDLVMPVMDGYEVLKQLKRNDHTCEVPVIILSNLVESHSKKYGLSLGASRYLVKVSVVPKKVVEVADELLATE